MSDLVTCIMPTADRRAFVPAAIAGFLAQDYEPRELLIADDGTDAVADLVPDDPRIRYVRMESGLPLGAKRNVACELAAGEVIAHWDDDDWYPPDRISRQVEALRAADVCGSSRLYFRDSAARRAWLYSYHGDGRPWLAGSTLAYRRRAWERHHFRAVRVGEDAHFVWDQPPARVADLADPTLCVAGIHAGNTSRKRPGGALWRPVDADVVERLMAEASQPGGAGKPGRRGAALLAVASGIGDVIRATPLIRVLHRLGYAVDVLCAPDYPQTLELLAGAPEIARLIQAPAADAVGPAAVPELAGSEYDVACFTYLARPLETHVRARRRLRFPGRPWLRDGDSRSAERLARQLGWEGEMPPPFVAVADRDFQLPPGTVALHAGCKRGWPWKKWHGFVELAERLEHVALIGTAEDLDVTGTYFAEPYAWPAHARDFIGRLTLPETAALIRQCAALVCNDSGMQHIGAAVGTPTFPIFGITSPEREIIAAPHVHPVSKGLPCEPDCRRQPWGRRDCERHLECLQTLSPGEVLQHVQRAGVSPTLREASHRAAARVPVPAETVAVVVRLEGGIGDVLLASALLEALYDDLRRCTIDVYYHDPEAARFVFANAAFVRGVHPNARLAADERHADLSVRTLQFVRYAVRNPGKLERVCPDFAGRLREAAGRLETVRGLADRQPALDGLWGRLSAAAGRNVLGNFGYLGAVGVSRTTELFLAPDPTAYRLLEESLGGAPPYITVHDGFDNGTRVAPGQATKCWPLDHWEALVGELKAAWSDHRVVQVGARKSRHIPGVDLDLVDRTSLHETAWILKNARLHIDSDSGLVHMARALHTPAVALFGPTDAAFYGHAENTNLVATTCTGCWWSTPDWLARCPRGLARPECMDGIGTDRVLVAAAHHLAERPGNASAGQVLCYDGALCREHAALLADMCAALELPQRPITEHIQQPRTGVYIHASKQWEYLYALTALQAAFGRAQGLHVADLGGGRGALAPYLAHLGHQVETFDVDYGWDDAGDPTVGLRFREWARTAGFRARFGSLFNVPAPSASFDVVTCISVVEHVPFKEYALREALRLLRPGGLLVLTFDLANQPERFEDGMRREIFSPERLAASLTHIGIECGLPDPDDVEASARRIAADGVRGIPQGMTVAGMVLRRA